MCPLPGLPRLFLLLRKRAQQAPTGEGGCHANTHTHTHTYIYAHTYTYIMHIHTSVHTYTHAQCTHTLSHTHTHTHTHTQTHEHMLMPTDPLRSETRCPLPWHVPWASSCVWCWRPHARSASVLPWKLSGSVCCDVCSLQSTFKLGAEEHTQGAHQCSLGSSVVV